MITGVHSSRIPEAWPHVLPLLAPAFARCRRYLPEDIYERLCDARMQLWTAPTLAVVTEINVFPRRKECAWLYLGGRGLRRFARPLQAEIEAWAQSIGCDVMTGGGRDEWETVLGRHGWKRAAIVMEK